MSKLPIADKDEKTEQVDTAVASFKKQRGAARTREQIMADATKALARIRKEREEGLEHYPAEEYEPGLTPAFTSPEAAMAHILAGKKVVAHQPPKEEDAPIAPREVEPDGIT